MNAIPHRDNQLLFRAFSQNLSGIGLLALLLAGVHFLSFWLRFEGQLGQVETRCFLTTVAWAAGIQLVVFAWFHLVRGWTRPASFYDLVLLAQAATCSQFLFFIFNRVVTATPRIPNSIFLLDWGTTIVVLGGMRSVVRGIREWSWGSFAHDRVPTLIVGANGSGESLLKAIIQDGRRRYRVVGFIDQDDQGIGMRIDGVPVLGRLEQACALARRHGVREILVANDGISGRQIRQLVDEAREGDLEVRVLPSYAQMIAGQVAIQPRPVAIEDLLRREPVVLDLESIGRWIHDRVLLVTGSAGSIGSEICRQLLQFSPRRLVLLDRSETGQFFLERELRTMGSPVELEVCIADVLDRSRIRDVLRQHRPDVVFHAAAYKHVPLMETHPAEAVKNIVLATRQMADLSAESGAGSFVLISTDKAVHPTSVMGVCKRTAELYVQSQADHPTCRFVTVRFGNVLDSAGSVVQVFRQQIAAGGPVTVTDPAMERFFMTIPEASRLVIQAGAIGNGGQILVLDMGDPVRIVDLATDMIRLSGLRVGDDIAVEFTGLRPGEKMYEELHIEGEEQVLTCHPKIIVAHGMPCDRAWIVARIDELERLAHDAPQRVVTQLHRIVPEYRPAAAPHLLRLRRAA